MSSEIYDTDYNSFIHILGTAHFTRRSIQEAHQAVEKTGTKDLAIELDPRRFNLLNGACLTCPRHGTCTTKCEFIEASEALGNVDANIWLIDMTENQMRGRIRQLMTPIEASQGAYPVFSIMGDRELPWLWERGHKDEVIRRSEKMLEVLRRAFPSVWRVLIKERNALMAARLAWIASKRMDEGEKPNILALTGAAHVEEIKELLRHPITIKENLKRLRLSFSPPTLIRRVGIMGD